jgi:hypothetical protein
MYRSEAAETGLARGSATYPIGIGAGSCWAILPPDRQATRLEQKCRSRNSQTSTCEQNGLRCVNFLRVLSMTMESCLKSWHDAGSCLCTGEHSIWRCTPGTSPRKPYWSWDRKRTCNWCRASENRSSQRMRNELNRGGAMSTQWGANQSLTQGGRSLCRRQCHGRSTKGKLTQA